MREKVTFVIPAAGEGRRMQVGFPNTPKALVPVGGRPMIHLLLDAIAETSLDSETVVVVSPAVHSAIAESLTGRRVRYSVQYPARGTGDAVLSARSATESDCMTIAVLFVDQPLISARTLLQLVTRHRESGATITLVTVPLPDFEDWRIGFKDWGRVIRDSDHRIVDIVEARNATREQLAISEVNPSLYCFRAPWIWEALAQLSPANAQGEILLTDVVPLAVTGGLTVETIAMKDPREAVGANTPTQLATLEQVYQQRFRSR